MTIERCKTKCLLYLKMRWHETVGLPYNTNKVSTIYIMKEQGNVREGLLKRKNTRFKKLKFDLKSTSH